MKDATKDHSANSVSMIKEIWDDDLSMISPRYDQKYWLLNNDRPVTLNNRQIYVAPQRIFVTPQFWISVNIPM